MAPLSLWGAGEDELARTVGEARAAREQYVTQVRSEVEAQLGPDASPEAIHAAVTQREGKDFLDTIQYSLADIPEDQRLMVAEDILTDHPDVRAAIEAQHDTASVSDATERVMVNEAIARAVKVDGGVDIKAVSTLLEKLPGGMESTALRLIKSESPVARAVALTLLENPTAAGGRRRSAAIAMAQRERLYNQHFAGWDKLATVFRRHEGVGWFQDFWDGRGRNAFNRRVFLEVEGRGNKSTYVPDANPVVIKAADLFETGMDIMRIEQQHVGTVGAARLGDDSVG